MVVMVRLRLAVLSVALVVAACGTGGEGATTTAEPSTTSVVPTTTTTATPVTTTTTEAITTTLPASTTTSPNPDGADGSGCSPGSDTSLPEGRWYGIVVNSTEDSLEFDLACRFTGQAAIDASAEDGEESPPPNDYYVRNQDSRTRTLAIAATTPVVFYPTGDPASEGYSTFGAWRDMVATRGNFFGVWLTVVDGTVVSMIEQWPLSRVRTQT